MLRTLRILLAATALCLVSACLLSCAKQSSPTNPVGGSGGGGELNGSLATTGSQYAHTFTKVGTFNYRCSVHPTCAGLTGTIVVLAAGGAIQNCVLSITQSGGSSGTYGSTCAGLSLQRDTVFVGNVVTWTNNSPFPHTVTSQ